MKGLAQDPNCSSISTIDSFLMVGLEGFGNSSAAFFGLFLPATFVLVSLFHFHG